MRRPPPKQKPTRPRDVPRDRSVRACRASSMSPRTVAGSCVVLQDSYSDLSRPCTQGFPRNRSGTTWFDAQWDEEKRNASMNNEIIQMRKKEDSSVIR